MKNDKEKRAREKEKKEMEKKRKNYMTTWAEHVYVKTRYISKNILGVY